MNYCTYADIESLFGPANISKWADLDNDQNDDTIAARIARAIIVASAQIDDRLRNGPYALPIIGDLPTIVNLAAALAGVWLYESRGVQDFSPDSGFPVHRLRWHREQSERTLRELLAGTLRIDAPMVGRGTTSPIVVND